MPEIRKRVRNGKISWLARHYDPAGRRVSKTFGRKEDARRWLVKIENAKDAGDYIDPARARVTVSTFADKWLATQGHLKPSTRARYESILTKHVKSRWQNVPLGKVTHADVAEWIHSIRLAPASVRYIHRVLFLIFELAVRDGRISKNPAAGGAAP